ncbi:High-affinity iron permease [Liberibacter crescens BT-1]|uniref:High-affinity iron permease n=1 Tax=Liberibacter crescens (strain BT-1) TaxID=1215343 RepID=L0EW87_LIBCB|nr:FTR1 family protein [Liberibacter crescens]AGA64923.1 High-affinity iron permease [Liberibacter crescens BT-1]AMC12948.1 hypothetical protein RL73_04690 [Liberibacter crescens]
MGVPLFIVWRESVEALLIIGILYSWLQREKMTSHVKSLWIGSGLGILLSGILGIIMFIAGHWFSGPGGEYFFTFMMIFASLLILHTVIWMYRNGKNLKKELESEAAQSITSSGTFGIMMLAMFAVAREGSETVIFLSGVGAQQKGSSLGLFILGGIIGFILAVLTFILLQKFSKIISWKWFFRISSFLLLTIGGAIAVNGFDKAAGQLSAYELPEWLYWFMDDPLWNTEWLLADNNILTALTGYHSNPSLMQVSVLCLYWITAIIMCNTWNKKNITKRNPLIV